MAYKKIRITDQVQAVMNYGFTSAANGLETEMDEDLADSMIRMGVAEEVKEPKKPGRPKKAE